MIIPFVIFAVMVLVLLLVTLYMIYPSSGRATTVPGLEPSSDSDGNLADIVQAGSLARLLIHLHSKLGDIVSFWYGTQLMISVATSELCAEISHLSNGSGSLARTLFRFIGENSLLVKDGEEAAKRRKQMEKCLTAERISDEMKLFETVSRDVEKKWSAMLNEEHIPLSRHMQAASFKILTRYLLGEGMSDDKKMMEFRKNFEQCYEVMESRLFSGSAESDSEFKENSRRFSTGRSALEKTISSLTTGSKSDRGVFIDLLKEQFKNADNGDTVINDEVITVLVESVPTTANLLIWCFYFLSTHEEVQEKLYEEVSEVKGELTAAVLTKLKYMRCVIKETLRCSQIKPYTVRKLNTDHRLNEHDIPAETPVITCLSALMSDEKTFPDPQRFDPTRFEDSDKIPKYSFCPFGYAGSRMCPGESLSYTICQVVLATLLSKYKIALIPDLVIEHKFGITTQPSDEVWITISKR